MTEMLIGSSALILAILFIRLVCKNSLSCRVRYALWGLAVLRLLIPVSLPIARQAALPAAQGLAVQKLQAAAFIGVERQPEAQALGNVLGTHAPADASGVLGGVARRAENVWQVVWRAGITVAGAYFLFINLQFYAALRKNRMPWRAEGCGRNVYLVEEGLSSPCVFMGSIYLTPEAVRTEESLKHVLAHEETHLAHLDPVWSLLRCVCLAVYWFHPLVWLAARCSCVDCELACDEGALKRLGGDRLAYGRTLLSLISGSRRGARPYLAATTMGGGKKLLKERIKRIAERPRQFLAVSVIAMLAMGMLTAFAFVSAETEGRALTPEEIELVNTEFEQIKTVYTDDGPYVFANPTNGFFASYYEDVRDMNFDEFLAYFPPRYGEGRVTEEEFQALREAVGCSLSEAASLCLSADTLEDCLIPVSRHSRAWADETLLRYAGITSEEIRSAVHLPYLEAYGAWYGFVSDFGAGYFNCFGGKVYEGRAAELYGNLRENGDYDRLTLEKSGEGWRIRSFTPVAGK